MVKNAWWKTTVFTELRDSEFTDEEQAGVDHLMEMMLAARQQVILRKVLRQEPKDSGQKALDEGLII